MKVNGQFHISAALPNIQIPEDPFFKMSGPQRWFLRRGSLYKRLGGSHSRSGSFGKRKESLGMRRGVAGLVVPYVSKDLVASSSVNH